MAKRFAIIGTGKMGNALARGIVTGGLAEGDNLTAFDTDSERVGSLASELGFRPSASATAAVERADVVILAVKPNIVPQVLREIGDRVGGRLVISIAAGVETKSIEGALPGTARVIRAMPNIACSVGEGATAFALGSRALAEDATLARTLFESVGKAVRVEESMLHAVTGLSGSGPGFLCVVIEGLIEGAVRAGLQKELATELALQTVVGTGRTLQETDWSPGELRNAVAVPGGTTMAGLAELDRADIVGALRKAVKAATRRSKELASGS